MIQTHDRSWWATFRLESENKWAWQGPFIKVGPRLVGFGWALWAFYLRVCPVWALALILSTLTQLTQKRPK